MSQPSRSMARSAAPLAERIDRLTKAAPIRNFHALPLAGARRAMGRELEARFESFCSDLAAADVSFSGPALDSFFAPDGPLASAQELAAEAFGADAAFFASCGTTMSNKIALQALGGWNRTLLLDSSSHQSLTFAAHSIGMAVTSSSSVLVDGNLVPDLEGMVTKLGVAARTGQPFDVVAITASSYDGYIITMETVLPRLVAASPSTAILIDSAWGAIHSFGAETRCHTALHATKQMREAGWNLPPIVVTTSAHKSMCALRQATIILIANGLDIIPELHSALFMHHTTSPSWPILASLDLARVHAEQDGTDSVKTAIALRNGFAETIQADPLLDALLANGPDHFQYCKDIIQDPMKIAIATEPLGEPTSVRRQLFFEHDIYVARCNARGILLNFTIGVDQDDVDALVAALRSIVRTKARVNQSKDSSLTTGKEINEYVVPYPPGVPIARPGDIWTESHESALRRETAAGAEIFRLAGLCKERRGA